MTTISISGGIPAHLVHEAYSQPTLPAADEIYNEWYGITVNDSKVTGE